MIFNNDYVIIWSWIPNLSKICENEEIDSNSLIFKCQEKNGTSFQTPNAFLKEKWLCLKKGQKLHVYRLLKKAQISQFCENNQFLYKNMVKNDVSWYENRKNNNNIAIKEVGVVK